MMHLQLSAIVMDVARAGKTGKVADKENKE